MKCREVHERRPSQHSYMHFADVPSLVTLDTVNNWLYASPQASCKIVTRQVFQLIPDSGCFLNRPACATLFSSHQCLHSWHFCLSGRFVAGLVSFTVSAMTDPWQECLDHCVEIAKQAGKVNLFIAGICFIQLAWKSPCFALKIAAELSKLCEYVHCIIDSC